MLERMKRRKIKNVKELGGVYRKLSRIVDKTIIDACFVISSDKNSYTAYKKLIKIDIDGLTTDRRGAYRSVYHEFGHHLDNCLGRVSHNPMFTEALRQDAIRFEDRYNLYKVNRDVNINPHLHGLSDILTGVINVSLKYRHSNDYYNVSYAVEQEAFAHFFEAYAREDIKKIDVYETYLPETWFVFKSLLGV